MEIIYKSADQERNTHIQYKDSYCIRDNLFQKKYLALIKNLDTESIKTVDTILERMQRILSGDDHELDLFDKDEKRKIKKMQNEFYNNISKISSTAFMYKSYVLPENYFDPIVFYYRYGYELFHSVEKIKNGDIIDAGAYIGDSTLLFSEMTCKKVFAFEALEKNCEKIKKTIDLNHVSNIEIINEAVGKVTCYADIEENEISNWSTMKPYKSRKYESKKNISVRSLDDFVTENRISVALIKLHIEGMEFDAIQGAEKTLRTQRPTLLIHIHHTPNDFWRIKPYIESLNLGYQFTIYKPANGYVFTGTMLLAEVI